MNTFLDEIKNKTKAEIVETINQKLTPSLFGQIEKIFDDQESVQTLKNNNDLKENFIFAITFAVSKFATKEINQNPQNPKQRQMINDTFFDKFKIFYHHNHVC